jgi:hypothetical protein
VEYRPTTSLRTLGGLSKLTVAAATVVLIMTPLPTVAATKEEIENQLRNLWKDRPDYVAAVHNHTQPMRVVHAVAPTVGPRQHNTRESMSTFLSYSVQMARLRMCASSIPPTTDLTKPAWT